MSPQTCTSPSITEHGQLRLSADDQGLHCHHDEAPVIVGLQAEIGCDRGARLHPRIADQGSDQNGWWTTWTCEHNEFTYRLTLRGTPCPGGWVISAELAMPRDNHRPSDALDAESALRLTIADLPGLERLLSHNIFWHCWTGPHTGSSLAELPTTDQMSLLWCSGDRHHLLLPLSDGPWRGVIRGHDGGIAIDLAATCGGLRRIAHPIAVLTVGSDPLTCFRDAVEAARQQLPEAGPRREDRPFPAPFAYLGWCTWDAFYKEVSTAGMVAKAEEFAAKGVPIRWSIVDDGWSPVRDGKLLSTGIDQEKFPGGFAPLKAAMREHLDLDWLGVWHAFMGGWDGIAPEGEVVAQQDDCLLHCHGGDIVPDPAGGAYRFYDRWHRSLAAQGIDFVKVDNQSAIRDLVRGTCPVGQATAGLQHALAASTGTHFNGGLLHCMAMAPETIWRHGGGTVARNSDDFYPRKDGWFIQHCLQNGFNGLIQGELIWCDYDMWYTSHPDAQRHALLRAISGGPIYISDKVGETDPERLIPVICDDGRILRCDRPARPIARCCYLDATGGDEALTLFTTSADVTILASFNLADHDQTCSVGPADCPDLAGQAAWLVDPLAGTATRLAADERLSLRLAAGETWYGYCCPDNGPRLLGPCDRYAAPAAIHPLAGGHVSADQGGEHWLLDPDGEARPSCAGGPCAISGGTALRRVTLPAGAGPWPVHLG